MRKPDNFSLLVRYVLLVAICCSSACKHSSNHQANADTDNTVPQQPGEPVKVTAERLYADYEADRTAADQKYKGKQLLVTGRVDAPAEEMGDEEVVILSNGKPTSESDVEAYFDPSIKGSLAELERGQKLNLLCRCEGKINGVELKDCSIQP